MLFGLILGTARGAPQRGAKRASTGVFFQTQRNGAALPRVCVRDRGVCPPAPSWAGNGRGAQTTPLIPAAVTAAAGGAESLGDGASRPHQIQRHAAPFRHGLRGKCRVPAERACRPYLQGARDGTRQPTALASQLRSRPNPRAQESTGHLPDQLIGTPSSQEARPWGKSARCPGDKEVTLPLRRSQCADAFIPWLPLPC